MKTDSISVAQKQANTRFTNEYDAAQKSAKRRCTSEYDRDHDTEKSNVKCTMIASNEGKFVTNITDTRTHRHNINIVTKNLCTEDPSAENTVLVLSLKLLIAFV